MDGIGKEYDVRSTIRRCWPLFLLSFAVNGILIPGMVLSTYCAFGVSGETRRVIVVFGQYLTPLLAGWCAFFVLTPYIDSDGNEIFYIWKRSKAGEVVGAFVCYLVTAAVPYLLYGQIFSGMAAEWLRIMIESFLFMALVYFLAFLVRRMALVMIPVICYAFASAFYRGEDVPFYLYYDVHAADPELLLDHYLPLTAAAAVLFLAGVLLNLKMERYK